MTGRPPADDEGVDAADGETVDAADGEGDGVSDGADETDAVEAPVLERVSIRSEVGDRSPTVDDIECTIRLPDDLAGDLDDYCRRRYLPREDAVRSLLSDWLDGQAVE
ncbi:hypothetical protein [Halovivax cerinus]|uniref:Ribbon-helix-helix protein CopG domain-containing protein n=1 Tax=Halovivax cerinus TaxID=1487865 RepID=A0ABD5NKV9_9EURY|nr:hypothetical protein [Halovivax cerinus]